MARGHAPLVARARGNGHEVLVHLPMEPLNAAGYDTGPNALMVGLSDLELHRRLNWNLGQFQGYCRTTLSFARNDTYFWCEISR